jgi:hypothetical protein
MEDEKEDQQTTGKAYSQTENIDDYVSFMAKNITQCYF